MLIRKWARQNTNQSSLARNTDQMHRQFQFIKLARKVGRKDIEVRHRGYFWNAWKECRLRSCRLPN